MTENDPLPVSTTDDTDDTDNIDDSAVHQNDDSSIDPKTKVLLKWADITRFLPHRYPFLLVDRIVELAPGKYAKGYKNVTSNEPFFNGHFPGLPVMPGVLQIEALAQAAGVLSSTFEGVSPATHVAYLMSLHDVKFRRIVEPGDRLDLHVEVMQMKRSIVKVRAKATVDGARACEAIITAAVRERPKA